MSHDDLISTKWGRITSQEWLRKRQQEELDRCMGPEQMHYVFLGIPFRDANEVEIVDHEFRALLQDDRDAAMSQLECEFHADRARQGQRAAQALARREAAKAAKAAADAQRKAEKAADKAAVKAFAKRRTAKHPTDHQLPLV
jgi:hypothetical protein